MWSSQEVAEGNSAEVIKKAWLLTQRSSRINTPVEAGSFLCMRNGMQTCGRHARLTELTKLISSFLPEKVKQG